jgi:hypothetical protein
MKKEKSGGVCSNKTKNKEQNEQEDLKKSFSS